VDYLIGNHDGTFCPLREENSYEAKNFSFRNDSYICNAIDQKEFLIFGTFSAVM
jgi:hypothetical protein